jgi:phosphoribosylglycinamide formyltransferase-1
MKKIVILFSGSGTNLAYILENMHGREVEVVSAITNNPDAGGISHALKHGIVPVVIDHREFPDRESFDERLVREIERHRPDLTVLAGFMRILTPKFTRRVHAINLHPSLLPRHRGLHAIERSYEDEHDSGGVTVHIVSDELDAGDIVLSREVDKRDMDFDTYRSTIRKIEKEALADGIRSVLGMKISS